MALNLLRLPTPLSLNAKLLANSHYTILGRSDYYGAVLIHYDPTISYCGICSLEIPDGPVWTIIGPLNFEAFLALLPLRKIEIDAGPDRDIWMASCGRRPVGISH